MGLYVAAKQTMVSAIALSGRLDLMGVRNLYDSNKYHSTIIASRQEFPVDQLIHPKEEFTGIIKDWDIFNSKYDEPDGDRCLVAILSCPVLEELHRQAIALGGESDYEVYHPHITVSYRYKQKLNLKTLPVDYLVRFSPVLTVQPLEFY